MPPNDALITDAHDWSLISNHGLAGFAETVEVSGATELFQCFQSTTFKGDKWVFRGHGRSGWKLHPTIERLANEQHISPHVEQYVERQSKRRAHHYLSDLPDEDDDLEWIALMQHHGAPTRLLDWTRSAYDCGLFRRRSCRPCRPQATAAIHTQASRTVRYLGD